ncbi:hypothetical protein BDA99DRAFT_566130 [Phascolomyces articulosus]|uniref:Uncharacterized protein n=1 Tax=Phascolomyces articulosus TaxID=60185 RepID=A0AAD5JZT1_9FUNG|nr:hypothetical protein BDA99DRAFT_566130 [Phascolomyces articulosus]
MFSSIVNNIRDKFAANKNKPPPSSNTIPDVRKSSVDHSSGDEEDHLHPHQQLLSRTISSPSTSLHRPRTSMDEAAAEANNNNSGIGRKMSVTEAIPVRRRSTLFGISNVSADDYIQKDLISSSWS